MGELARFNDAVNFTGGGLSSWQFQPSRAGYRAGEGSDWKQHLIPQVGGLAWGNSPNREKQLHLVTETATRQTIQTNPGSNRAKAQDSPIPDEEDEWVSDFLRKVDILLTERTRLLE